MNLRKLMLISLLTIAPLRGAMAAESTDYKCLAGPGFVSVALSRAAIQREGYSMMAGSFIVTSDDYGAALAQPVTAFLNLVNDRSVQTLVLSARAGEQKQTKYSVDPEATPNLVLTVASKNGQTTQVSIQCKTEAEWGLEAEITEGKIQASMGVGPN